MMGRESGSAPPPRGISPAVSYSALANLPSPELATNPASAGGSVMDDGRATLVSVPGSAASTSDSYSTTYVIERPYQPHRRGFWDVLGLGLNKKRGVARPLLFPSPPGTPSPFASNASWRTRVRKFVWSEEMRYMLVALCFFCVLIQVALMYRWAQSGVRVTDTLPSVRPAEFDSSTAFADAPLPAEAAGGAGRGGRPPPAPRKLPRSAAAVLSKFRDSQAQNGGPQRRAINPRRSPPPSRTPPTSHLHAPPSTTPAPPSRPSHPSHTPPPLPSSVSASVEDLLTSVLSAQTSRALLPAVRSRADLNRDGRVSPQELQRFLARHGRDRVTLGVERAVAAALDATWGPLAEDLPPNKNSRACELKFDPLERSHLEVSLSDGLQFADTRPFCVEAWVKPSAPAEREDGPDYFGGVILSKYNGGVQGQLRLEILGDGSLKLHREVAPYGLQADVRIPAGVYTHVAASYGFGWAALYVNGTMAGMQREGGVPDDSVTPVLIGATLDKGEPSGFFSGAIADMRIWSMSCQQVDMKAHMNHTLSGWEHGLQAYWRFDECMGGKVRDSAGVHDGVVRGGARWAHAALGLGVGDEEAQCKKWAKDRLGIAA